MSRYRRALDRALDRLVLVAALAGAVVYVVRPREPSGWAGYMAAHRAVRDERRNGPRRRHDVGATRRRSCR